MTYRTLCCITLLSSLSGMNQGKIQKLPTPALRDQLSPVSLIAPPKPTEPEEQQNTQLIPPIAQPAAALMELFEQSRLPQPPVSISDASPTQDDFPEVFICSPSPSEELLGTLQVEPASGLVVLPPPPAAPSPGKEVLPPQGKSLEKQVQPPRSHRIPLGKPAEDVSLPVYYPPIRLSFLDLSYIGLEQIPSEIGQLTHLKELELSHNCLTSLPEELVSLKRLRYLGAAHNQLHTLPAELSLLQQLDECQLSHNALETMPGGLERLTKLAFFDLSYNMLHEAPPLPSSLEELHLNANQLDTITGIGRLTNLQILSLAHNRLSKLSPELVHLTRLKMLNLMNNPFDSYEDGTSASAAHILFRLAGRPSLRAAKKLLKLRPGLLRASLTPLMKEDLTITNRLTYAFCMSLLVNNLTRIKQQLIESPDEVLMHTHGSIALYEWLLTLIYEGALHWGNTLNSSFWHYTLSDEDRTLPDHLKYYLQLRLEKNIIDQVELKEN